MIVAIAEEAFSRQLLAVSGLSLGKATANCKLQNENCKLRNEEKTLLTLARTE
jgi:hypothetical protein